LTVPKRNLSATFSEIELDFLDERHRLGQSIFEQMGALSPCFWYDRDTDWTNRYVGTS